LACELLCGSSKATEFHRADPRTCETCKGASKRLEYSSSDRLMIGRGSVFQRVRTAPVGKRKGNYSTARRLLDDPIDEQAYREDVFA